MHRAFEADDTSDLVSARKPRCERDARWDRARYRNGPRTEWAPHNRTVSLSFCLITCLLPFTARRHAIALELGKAGLQNRQHDEYRASPYHQLCEPAADDAGRQDRAGNSSARREGSKLTILIQQKVQESEGQQQLANCLTKAVAGPIAPARCRPPAPMAVR